MFHFKKFSIDDSAAAMKIGTDAVLLGSWAPCENETRVLDIGTGCGILAIMMAQRNYEVPVDAVEIDKNAVHSAKLNFSLSPWSRQLSLHHTSIQDFSLSTTQRYSLIISNPPFFTASLKPPDKARNMARHNDILPVSTLLEITSKLLSANGKAAFIIPFESYVSWISIASGFLLYPDLATKVRSSPEHNPHRVMILFSKKSNPSVIENDIEIYSSRNIYSDEYRNLTKDFYLNF